MTERTREVISALIYAALETADMAWNRGVFVGLAIGTPLGAIIVFLILEVAP